jgi:hypothetical protein
VSKLSAKALKVIDDARIRTHARVLLRRLGYDMDNYKHDEAEATVVRTLRTVERAAVRRALEDPPG